MVHSSAGGRPLLPRPHESLSESACIITTESLPSGAFANSVVPPPRKPKTRTKTSEEWEEQADKIRELYEAKKLTLEAVIRTLEEQYGFQASKKQYTTKLKEWGLEKNIGEKDMRAVTCKARKRKAEDPLKETTYRLRKRTVPPQRIERYKRDHHITDETAISEAATPSDLSCETPRSLVSSDSPPSGLPSSPQLYDQISNTNHSLSVPPLVSHAHLHWNAYCSAPRYLKLLEYLLCNSGHHFLSTNTNESSAAVYENIIDYCFRFLLDQGSEYCFCGRLLTLHPEQDHVNLHDWLFHRLGNGFNQTVFECEGLYLVNARIHRVLNQTCVASRAMKAVTLPPFQTLVDTADSYQLAFGDRARGCRVCGLLPQLLTFKTFIEAIRLNDLSPAPITSIIDPHYWFTRLREMTQAWLRAPDNLLALHSLCHLSGTTAIVTRHERDIASMTSHKHDDIPILVALSRVGMHLMPLFLGAGEMNYSL